MVGGQLTISEESRHALHTRLAEVLGSQEAVVLMEHLPPVGWADVATKRDLDGLAVATKRDLDHLAIELRGEMVELRGDLRGEMAELRGELVGAIGQLRFDLGAQIRSTYVGTAATMLASIGAVAAVIGLMR